VSSSATPPPELHLPDLPEVPVSLRPLAPPAHRRQPLPWGQRLRNALMAYLPLLLMAALAGSTWWLVKNTPSPDRPAASGAPRQDPDYTMHRFNITRFDAQGRFALRIEGEVLRHYPATDHFEIDGVRLHAVAPDGRTTDATARRALSNADGSEVQLIGAAQVVAQVEGGDTLRIDSEFLHAFLRFERLRSHLPVLVRRGADETRAAGLDYDHLDRRLLLRGPVRSVYRPGAGPSAAERQKQGASATALAASAPQESTR
jgi:lipopolysaccharide export system protein LptC